MTCFYHSLGVLAGVLILVVIAGVIVFCRIMSKQVK